MRLDDLKVGDMIEIVAFFSDCSETLYETPDDIKDEDSTFFTKHYGKIYTVEKIDGSEDTYPIYTKELGTSQSFSPKEVELSKVTNWKKRLTNE